MTAIMDQAVAMIKPPLSEADCDKFVKVGKELFPLEQKAKSSCKSLGGSKAALCAYPTFAINEALSLTKKQRGIRWPVPAFAIFDLMGNGTFSLSLHVGSSWRTGIELGGFSSRLMMEAIETSSFYMEYEKKLKRWVSSEWFLGSQDVILKTNFNHTIPPKVREHIREIQKGKLFSRLLVIAEVDEWGIEPRPADPLLVGESNGLFFLLDRFDTTPLESYVSKEFSVA